MSPPASPRPLVLLVGFLGAGKTTFLREFLPVLAERNVRPAVVLNDYGNAVIDAQTLKTLAEEVHAINGSCVCCDASAGLADALLNLPDRERSVVLVECNGTTDPFRLIELLTVQPELHSRFHPLLLVGIIDASRWQRRAFNNALERMQIEPASHLLFTRDSSVELKRLRRVKEDIQWMNPRAEEITAEKFANELQRLVTRDDAKSGSVHDSTPCKEEEAHFHPRPADGEHGHSLSHGFCVAQLTLPKRVSGVALMQWLQELPSEVIRAKGVVELEEMPGRYFVFNRTDDNRENPTMFLLPAEPSVPPTAVLIGVRLHFDRLKEQVDKLFADSWQSNLGKIEQQR